MLKCYRADLHIHTCLSACADLTMSPKRIVERATEEKIDIIAICDHNSAENVLATKNAASGKALTVIPGMEISSREEVHTLALFEDIKTVLDFQTMVYRNLEPGENRDDVFGEQIIANEFDEVEGYNHELLGMPTSLKLKNIVGKIHDLGGLAIAAHVDKEVFSIFGQLGFIPEDLKLDALEISRHTGIMKIQNQFQDTENFPIIRSSDAHFLKDIGGIYSNFLLAEPSFVEIKKALTKKGDRVLLMEN